MVRRDQDGGHRSEKSGPKIPGFRAFVPRLCWAFSRACILSSAFDRREKRSDRRRFASSAILARVGRGTRAFLAGPVRIARGNVWRRFVFVSPGLHPRRFDERRGHFERDSANGKQKGKTGRFGPIGPETAQYQLPHNIVTFGMVRARDVRVYRERERRGERRSRFAISSRGSWAIKFYSRSFFCLAPNMSFFDNFERILNSSHFRCDIIVTTCSSRLYLVVRFENFT